MIWIRFTLAALPCASSETHTLNPALDLPAHFVGRVQAQEKERLTMKLELVEICQDQEQNKIKELDDPDNPLTWTRCFVAPGHGAIIDVVHPQTNLTFIYKKTLAECRKDYPDAIGMTVRDFSIRNKK